MKGGERRDCVARPPRVDLGAKIRARRRDRGFTLVDLAGRTGLSIGFLSQVERDITAPSLSSLALIAESLGASMHDFIKEPPPVTLHHRDDRQASFAIDAGRLSYERLSGTFPGKTLNAIRMNMPAGYRSETTSHEGEEFVFVLSGEVRYLLAERPYDLSSGDSLHFSARERHRVENRTGEPATVITVVTQDLFSEKRLPPRAEPTSPSVSRNLQPSSRELSKC
jgi:transcriptional regulator with XRE-family HTH domain